MSASSSRSEFNSVSLPAEDSAAPRAIDASCRVPLLVLLLGAALWLVIGSALGLIASIKFHAPGFLADRAWLTYGRVQAAALNARLYGFALPAAFGVALWILARLGGTTVSQPWLIGVGGKIWHLGVFVGVIAILAGDSTGFENLQMPRYAALLVFIGFLLIGLWTLLTLSRRRRVTLSSPQWFIMAALFWFPWIYSTANLLLQVFLVRGVMQPVVAWWFSDNLTFVCFSLLGLAAAFYLIPRMTGRRLHSDYLGLFVFWTLLLFGSWAVVPGVTAPVPAWMPALSTVAAGLLIIPLLAVAVNLHRTLEGKWTSLATEPASQFIWFGVAAWLSAGAMKIAGAMPAINAVTNFTWFTVAQSQLNTYGFFAMSLFGAIYYLLPRVADLEWPSSRAVRAHFWCAAIGILLLALPLAIGGIVQGLKLSHPQAAFVDVTKATLPFLRVSTIGDLLILAGNLLFAANLFGLAVSYGRVHFQPLLTWVKSDWNTVEVKS